MAKTKKPTGLTISRSGNKLVLKWKKGDKNYEDGQAFQYRFGGSKTWLSKSVGDNTTQKSIDVPVASYAPTTTTTLGAVYFRVRGNRKKYTETYKEKGKTKTRTVSPTVSEWAKKTFTIKKPNKPTGTVVVDESTTPASRATFSWNVKTGNDAYWFRDVQWQTILVKVGDAEKWTSSNRGWDSGTGGATGSKVINEPITALNDAPCKRVFRVRSRGPAGNSEWKYIRHTYAAPYMPQNVDAMVGDIPSGYLCTVSWETASVAGRPVDSTTIEYVMAVPAEDMSLPSGVTWQVGAQTAKQLGRKRVTFTIDDTLDDDQCLFVRVTNRHDTTTIGSEPIIARIGVLAEPSGLQVTTSTSGGVYRATVTATNESAVPDSFLVVRYVPASDPDGFDIGIIPHGQSSVTVTCPDWTQETGWAIEVYAAVGTAVETERADGIDSYAVYARFKSATISNGGAVPAAPSDVTVSQTEIPGTIQVVWSWAWALATAAELSWADHSDAWQSTDEPETYEVSSLNASIWNISGLETGKTWYVRVRLLNGETPGQWSEIASIDLSSAPAIPVLNVTPEVVTPGGALVASWVYMTTDGTPQVAAEVAEVTTSENVTAYETIATVETAQHATIDTSEWTPDEVRNLVVRVTSGSGKVSNWSEAVSVSVAEPPTCTITQTSLVQQTITEDGVQRTVESLTEMPMTVTVTGAGDGGTTTLAIVRADDYPMDRPDESNVTGHQGETILLMRQTGEEQMFIQRDDLIGRLDDDAPYQIIASVQDEIGQTAQADPLDFEVHWTHQAVIPEGTVEEDNEHLICKITPIAPTGYAPGDTCDIYRLSVDKPELIYSAATFGTTYVDPYPTLGEYGGYRLVFVTIDGDYITPENELAWLDIQTDVESEYNVIDYGQGRVQLRLDVDLSSSWAKDFEETSYLGGSVQGDWNPAVVRSGTVSARIMTDDIDDITALRRLATHAGICHIRTKDGSSYPADIQVSEDRTSDTAHNVASVSLKITRVDPEEPDGLTLAEWEQTQEEEE